MKTANNTYTSDDGKHEKPVRPELAEVIQRHAFGLDENRQDAVSKRHQKNQRMVRANIKDLLDGGKLLEYGALAIAAQRQRRTLDDLIRKTPADGLITGIGAVNQTVFGPEKAQCMIMAYDYTVLAGTQGHFNHKKIDRMLRVTYDQRLPLIFFGEGGGGRPGDVDASAINVAGLHLTTFASFASLSGRAPVVGVVSGPCFAGNAALLGCCDVIIATQNSNIGMGGPVMVEGGGLGVFKPEEIGPIDVQSPNGVVDIEVADDVEMVATTKKYISYFQGPLSSWKCADQLQLRDIIPENRRRAYDIRRVINVLADTDSFLELRSKFGRSMVTGFIRIEGEPFGIFGNDCRYMGGAIEAEGADKVARLMQICNTHGIPILSMCDTPGFMVGPEVEMRAQVRHVCRMFVNGAHVTVPYFTVVLRRGYGLGVMAMAKGGFHESFFTVAWPTAEFGGMGLEGYVKMGFKKELQAIEDPDERETHYNKLVAKMYEKGKAINAATCLEIDAVIDPVETREWLMEGLRSVPKPIERGSHAFIDPW
jgi:acetyl-CoA carboxylase carboxyltransferase component